MFRQISIGAAAVLTAGMIAAGCGSDGDTIVTGSGNGDTSNTDQTGFTSVGSSNLAPDNGGLSPASTNATDFNVIYNQNAGSSDGVSAADNSAVILFTTADGRTFVTHSNGSSITPPVELQATDHANTSFDIQAASVSFLQTSGYENSGATADIVNAVRQNNGMVLLVMSGRTAAVSTANNLGNIGTSFGVHTGLWSWLFNPAFRGTEQLFSTTTANLVGSIPATATTSRYYNAPTNEFRFGWQRNAGAEIARNSGSAAPAVTGAIGTQTPGTSGVSPADTISFGLVTDGNQREQQLNGATVLAGSTPGRQFGTNGAIPANSITPGEAVSVLALVYTQIVTSKDVGTGFDADAAAGTGSFGGSTTALFNSSFNLATLSFETIARINPTGTSRFHNVNYQGNFRSYNNVAVVVYEEGSPSQLANTDNYAAGQTVETVVQKIAFRPSTTGGATAATPQDLSVRPQSLGQHTEFNSDSATAQTVETGGLLNSSATMIYGRDEGLADTVIFLQATDGTSANGQDDSGTAGGNTDRAIYAALLTAADLTATSTTDGDLVSGATFNPLLISTHNQVDVIANAAGNNQDEYTDPAQAEGTIINRNGEYILVGYTQNEGTRAATSFNVTRRRTLRMVAYQPVRFGNATTVFNTRFSAPAEISNPTALASGTVALNNGNVADNETHLPVNAWEFEGSIDYRCGFQSANNVIWALWEQSDTSEDRLFVRPVGVVNTVTPPTLAGSSTGTTEIEDATSERVQTVAFTTGGTAGTTLDRNDVAFLDGGLPGTAAPAFGVGNVASCDLGTAGAATGSPVGGLFLAYVKTTDNTAPTIVTTTTTGDADGFDRGVFANAVLLAGTELGRQVIDNNFNEDDYTTALSTGTTVFTLQPVGAANTALGSTNQPNLTYVLFNEAEQASDAASNGLYLRTFDNQNFRGGTSTGSATDFIASFVPAIGTGGTTPLRLDHLTGGDVTAQVGTATSGNRFAVIFTEDGHDWLQATSDGRSVFTSGGSPAPALMDQERSSNVQVSRAYTAENDNCDTANVIYIFRKNDQQPNSRVSLRINSGQF